MRQILIVANWKMYMANEDSVEFFKVFNEQVRGVTGAEVVICPSFLSIGAVRDIASESNVSLGGQDLYWEKEGAFTGEVSALMLRECSCRYCIVGHSERRRLFGEGDEQVRRKAASALEYGLVPIICVGEDQAARQSGRKETMLRSQVKAAMSGLKQENAVKVVVAYEPLWAIGSGTPATGEDAGQAAKILRSQVAEDFNPEIAEKIKVLYGGSVSPDNIGEFISKEELDGALVGGASLKPDTFSNIIKNAVVIRR